MKLKRKHYAADGKEVIVVSNNVNFTHFSSAVSELSIRFRNEDACVRFEEMKFANGNKAVSIKDRSNRIMVQYTLILNPDTCED